MIHPAGRYLISAVFLFAWPLGAEEPQAARVVFQNSAERDVPPRLDQAPDVRWAGTNSVYLAVMGVGGVELTLDPAVDHWTQITPDGHGSREVWQTSRIGLSQDYVAVAAGIFTLGWKERQEKESGKDTTLDGLEIFEMIEDLDVTQNRLAVLGTRRGADRQISSDGAIAWVGAMNSGLSDLTPVLFSTAGSGARPVDSCGGFEIGAVRFLPNGQLVVVPGAEPGVFLYDQAGKLLWTWETDPLGLDIRCDFDDDQRALLSANPLARWSWLQQFLTVDDIVPLADGPGLLIRRATQTGTRWHLTQLRRDQPAITLDLPITAASSTARLRVDLRGEDAVFLVFDHARFLPPGPKKDHADRVRLIHGKLKP